MKHQKTCNYQKENYQGRTEGKRHKTQRKHSKMADVNPNIPTITPNTNGLNLFS